MKKILLLFILFYCSNSYSFEKKTNFSLDDFKSAQKTGKLIVVNSWNEFCTTCAAQTKIFQQAEKDFADVIFFYYEQTKNPDIAEYLNIDFWTTIAIFKNNKEILRTMGLTDKDKIYSLIKAGI